MSKKLTHEEFLKKLYLNNKDYREGVFEVVGKCEGSSNKILVRDKYGLCLMHAFRLIYHECKPTVSSAIDKTEYTINKFKEIHGDKFLYDKLKYVNGRAKVEIGCKEHGYFWQLIDNHVKYASGCPVCNKRVEVIKGDKKQCRKCGEIKSKKYFYKTPANKSGVTSNCKKCVAERIKIRREKDPLFRLKGNIQTTIKAKIRKKDNRTLDILGCNYKQLMAHLNNNKWGFKYEDGLYDIDHIIPTSLAKTEQKMLELNNYKNLQLLPIVYNRNAKKGKKYDEEDFKDWLEKTNFYKENFNYF